MPTVQIVREHVARHRYPQIAISAFDPVLLWRVRETLHVINAIPQLQLETVLTLIAPINTDDVGARCKLARQRYGVSSVVIGERAWQERKALACRQAAPGIRILFGMTIDTGAGPPCQNASDAARDRSYIARMERALRTTSDAVFTDRPDLIAKLDRKFMRRTPSTWPASASLSYNTLDR